MIRLPPRSTRTDTLFPYTTLFRSRGGSWPPSFPFALSLSKGCPCLQREKEEGRCFDKLSTNGWEGWRHGTVAFIGTSPARRTRIALPPIRSEERRVGKECVSTCRSRWSRYL